MPNDLVSVIIPCYRQARFLKDAIDSVLTQTYKQFEILVIDDGSPDNVREAIKPYTGVKLIEQPNQGAAIARNHGIEKSKGSFLVFLDADDRLTSNALESGVKFLKENPDYAFVTGLVHIIDDKGNFVEMPPQPVIKTDHYKTLLRSNYIWTPGVVMYRRSIFTTTKAFDPSAGGSADYELNIRIARKFRVGCHGEIVLEYRQHGANMTGNAAYMLKSGVSVRRAQYKYVKMDQRLLKEWKEGIRIIQKDVGERLVKQIKMKMRDPALRKTIGKDLWYIVKYYPEKIPAMFAHKLKTILHLKSRHN